MTKFKVVLAVLLLFAPALLAQGKRDPLTSDEVDQLREAAQEPEKRIRLYIKFERARLLAIEQTRSDPKLAQNRGERLHDLIEDVVTLNDELDDNLEEYSSRKADLRKVLKEVIQAETEFQLKLRALKEAESDPKVAEEAKEYEFVLQNATESVAQSLEDDRKLLDEQNTEFAKKKEEKKKS